jgi:hypothetical protein
MLGFRGGIGGSRQCGAGALELPRRSRGAAQQKNLNRIGYSAGWVSVHGRVGRGGSA